MAYFPMFIDLKDQLVLIVGGGMVALRKAQKLAPYGAQIVVIAPEITSEIEKIPGITCIKRAVEKKDLEMNPAMVIAATNQGDLNHLIASVCKEKHIPVNVVDDLENCSFLFPALVKQGEFSAGICTSGASPTAAVYYKERLKEMLPNHIDEILEWLESKRVELKESIPEQAKRAGVFRKLFEACMEKGAPLSEEELAQYTITSSVGSVALVGAGCGKADLITVRGLRLLQQCEAVVYDDLIDPELLEAVPESALRVYMGKRSGAHSAPQEEISKKLVELAQKGLKVVRLKGGDPYLFGRGGEEMLTLLEAGIECQEVPGIPSAIGIPAEAGIPVTHRGASRGLHIVTAHTSDTKDYLPADFDALAQLSGTLVFLMGLKQLPRIVKRLMAAGKSGDTPAAVLSGGNSPNPARARAPLSKIEAAVKEAGVSSPAIILIGEVAALDFNQERMPLEGVHIGVVGTKEIATKQQAAFEQLGAKTSWIARSVVKERDVDVNIQKLNENPCWIVFTSANGVKTFFRKTEKQDVNWEEMKNIRFAVIGAATEKVLEEYGIKAELCPKTYTSEGLANALVSVVNPEEEILLFRSSIGSPLLVEIPGKAGLKVKDVAIYDLESSEDESQSLEEMDYLTFSSASGVRLYFEKYKGIPQKTKCVCIGDVTARELVKYSEEPFLLAKEILVEGIVETVLEDYT